MKRNIIYSFFIALACIGFVACDNDDNDKGMNLPEGSKPSTNFTLGNCEDEQNAKDAIKMDVKTWGDGKTDKEFASIELFGDGHFLITTPNALNAPKRATDGTRKANRPASILKKSGKSPMTTRTGINNGTEDIDNGLYIYGTYTRVKDGVYKLSNNTMIEIKDGVVKGTATVTYTNRYGVSITIIVSIDYNYKQDAAIRQLCRSWKFNESEVWLYANNTCFVYGKQWMKYGRVLQEVTLSPEAKKWGFEEDDVLETDDCCKRIVFSPCGRYICFYADRSIEVGHWEWTNMKNGVLRLWEPVDLDDDDDDDDDWADVTVRFDGKQMYLYHDFMDEENDIVFRALGVSTFSAGY